MIKAGAPLPSQPITQRVEKTSMNFTVAALGMFAKKIRECGTECGELLSGSLCIIWAILNVNIAEAISYGKISSKGKSFMFTLWV